MHLFPKIPLKVTLIALALLFPAAYVVGYFSTANSDAFERLTDYVKGDKSVQSAVGNVKSVNLAYFQPQKLTWSANEGEATLVADVEGDKATLRYRAQLQKEGPSWKVISLTAN